jgi:hypothetical protein
VGLFVQPADFRVIVANELQRSGGSGTLEPWQQERADRALRKAEADIRTALAQNGWTFEQVERWPSGREFIETQALYWFHVFSGSEKDIGQEAVDKLDQRPVLGLLKPPRDAAGRTGGVGSGRLSTAGNLFPHDFSGRHRRRPW